MDRPLHRGSGCHECRRRKLKCTGTKPACDRCVRSSTPCVYDPVEKSKVALLRDEVLLLRQKVKALEAVMRPSLAPPDQHALLDCFLDVRHIAYDTAPLPQSPAARTAAFLLAAHFSPVHLPLAPTLLDATRAAIDDAIKAADPHLPDPRLVDAIHASSLLATWLLLHARVVESQQTLFGAAKLAIRFGLHKRPHAPDVFWQLLELDYTAAILMGVNVSLPWEDCPPEARVEAPWPHDPSLIPDLFKHKPPPASPPALVPKALVLLERAVRLGAHRERTQSPRASPPLSAVKETDSAISNVLELLPVSRPTLQLRLDCLHPHTLLLCARVRLHERLAARDHVSQVVWVQSAVAIVRLLDTLSQDELVHAANLMLAYAWTASYMVLLHERYYVPYHPDSDHAARIKADLDRLETLLDAAGAKMPVISSMFRTSVDQFNALRTPTDTTDTPDPDSNDDPNSDDDDS